jgi:N-acetylmuramoyl-L-alanine amidase
VSDINSCSIGIEIANPGHDYGYPDFPVAQIESVIALCREILARQAIPPERVLAHSDVAPLRKNDPGEKFPWDELFHAGVGLWVPAVEREGSQALSAGVRGADVTALQRRLADYGYGLAASGFYDATTAAVVTAFQRHFRPAQVDGVADSGTLATVDALLAARSTGRCNEVKQA